MRYVLGVSGKDSATAAIVSKLHCPEWDKIELFFNDTKADYPETVDWLRNVETFLGKPIAFIDGDLPSIIQGYTKDGSPFLPSQKARYCTREAKIQPMERWLGDSQAVLYSGLRADEGDRAGYSPSPQIQVKHPLIERKIALGGVYAILEAVNLLPPSFFWQTLYDRVCDIWDSSPNIFTGESFDLFLSTHQKRMLFSGRSRSNCYFCFYQRLYEFIWLSEAYPNLFEQACRYEKDSYTWKQGESLRDMVSPKRKEKIIEDRAKYIVGQIESIVYGQILSFESTEYTSPSCGLFCGK